MKCVIKNMFRPLYYHFKNKPQREFNRLFDKWGNYRRYEQVNGVNFLSFRFDIPDLQSFIWQFKELFVEEIYRFESDTTSPVIFDCGSNIGTSCLYFKTIFPNAKIKAFEADEKIASLLKSNLLLNNIDDIDVIAKAVWVDSYGVAFSSEGADGGSIVGSSNLHKIKSTRLKDHLMNELSIDLLKIDIEGAEYEVLKDCSDSLSHVKNIFVEYHSWNNNDQKLSEILSILENNNFRYYIEDISKRRTPFINNGKEGNMDLQLNIFGIQRC